ncbi:LysR substrate-binding domain-containing protein [Catellatospora citrea]|uniref:LysR family transcriptional regulator n=1 Tax=Catellatospora citrea TaxID=53366 RepID=UPI00340E885B
MELRDIEIFLTLAEELHFGRTADRLRVSSARVSQVIKKQERRIGTTLFERTSRRVLLTPAGRRLQQELSVGYRQIMDGIQSVAAEAAGVNGVLTLGAMGPQPWMIPDLLDLFRSRHPAVEVRHREIQATAPLAEVKAGEVDAALVWLPVREPGITVGPVTHSSPVMLMVGAGHPLAGRETVCWEDLGDCTVLTGTDVPVSMEETFHPRRTPSGRPVARGPVASSWHEQITLVAEGSIVCGVAADAARFYPWPGIVYLPIRDAPPAQWTWVWLTARQTPLIRALSQATRDAQRSDQDRLTP